MVGGDAASYRDEQREGRAEAASVVAVELLLVVGEAVAPLLRDDRAVLEVSDLVRSVDVVLGRGPRDARVLARRRVHRAERVRSLVAGRRGRLVQDLSEAVGGAGRHPPGLTGAEIVDDRRQP